MTNTLKFLVFSAFAVLIWSAVNPHDYFTWILEVMPALIGFVIMVRTFKAFKLTELTYFLICIHAIILIIGGHYTYAKVPLFNDLKEYFDLSRNHYDRVGHFAQGFIPAIVIREILIRKSVVNGSGWMFFIIVSISLALSAFYEFIEWWVAVISGTAANDFLGTQGDIWDTQWDMFLAFIGASLSLLFLSKIHDKFLNNLVNQNRW